MAGYKLHRVTVLPGTLEAESLYFVTHASRPELVEIVVTGNTGTVIRKVIDTSTVQAMIDASLATQASTTVYSTFAEMPAPSTGIREGSTAFVVDASDDPTVVSGGATYILRHTPTPSWVKISESESLDLSLSWASLTGKPSSPVAEIDDAVSKRHTHSNKTQLDKIGEDNGLLTYNGALPVPGWSTSAW